MADEVRVWRYYLPSENGEGWGVAFVDSTGCLAIISDWGNYAYKWSSFGECFRSFLIRVNTGYLLSKVARSPCPPAIDVAKTAVAAKRAISELRRHQEISAEEAREEWDLVEAELESDGVYEYWLRTTCLCDAHELLVEAVDHQAVAMADKLWPRLVAAMRAELEREVKQ
jgi:hypothetical protein